MEYLLEVNSISKTYKKSDFKLDDVSFKLKSSTITAIIGRNACGKTTVINSILDLISIDQGFIKIFAKNAHNLSKDLKNDIAVIFDELNYYEVHTADKLNKIFKLAYKNWSEETYFSYIDKFEIDRSKKISKLSKGTKAKIAFAVSLSHKAKLLIFDEALVNLDPLSRESILDDLLDYCIDNEASILMTSHITSDIKRIADNLIFMDSGRIIFEVEKDDLIYNYGIARLNENDFARLEASEYIAFRRRSMQVDVLVKDKDEFVKMYNDLIVDNATIDEVLSILVEDLV